jgi:hypothetical protein
MYSFDNANHIHTFEGKPLCGTSSIMDVLYKPLTWWASGLACAELGWIKPLDSRKSNKEEINLQQIQREKVAQEFLDKYKTMTPLEYTKLLDKAYRAHTATLNKAATKGTNLHSEAENWVKSVMKGNEIKPHEKILPFVRWAKENVKRFLWSEAHCYSTTLWCGGISDCGVELNNGEYAIIDFKSSKEAYPSSFFQIAGYQLQIEENGLVSSNGKYFKMLEKSITQHIVIPFGANDPKPVFSGDIEGNKEAFKACLFLYKKLNNNNQ